MSDAERYHRLADEYRNQAAQERELAEQLRLLQVARTFDHVSTQALQRSAAGRQHQGENPKTRR